MKDLLSKLEKTNLLPLAFLGDSVHTQFVRKHVLENYNEKMQNFHKKASQFCKASHQSKVLEKIFNNLTDKEKEIVKRARNAKPKHTAKNSSSKDYMMATAFEALVGYLYLAENNERLFAILNYSIQEE